MLFALPLSNNCEYPASELLLVAMLPSTYEFCECVKFDFGQLQSQTSLQSDGCLDGLIGFFSLGEYGHSRDLSTVCFNNKFSTARFLEGRTWCRCYPSLHTHLILVHLLHLLRREELVH